MSKLLSKNVRIEGHRTSVRLERDMWEALEDICERERLGLNEMCTLVARAHRSGGFTSSLRVFIMNYYRDQDSVGMGLPAPLKEPEKEVAAG